MSEQNIDSVIPSARFPYRLLTILRKYSLSPSLSLNSYSVFENKNERDYHQHPEPVFIYVLDGLLIGSL
ncbi:MAG: hypothetical protein E3K29_00465 [Candidatus Brocadia sp.]|nr:hypothetical protein [Candidatus Brocadia sp.]